MSWQHVELNMIPGGELPVVHVSQFDTLRAFHFDLKVGEDDWTIPEGIHFELHCRKVDDNIVIIAPDSTDTSSVTFTTTEQLTACSGKNECELVAIDDEDDSLIIGSSGSLPGCLQRIWKSKAPYTYHVEYGFSCMGYEICGALGAKLACPDKEVYSMVGDGSFLMLHSELYTAVQEDKKINIMLFDNSGWGCIENLQNNQGTDTFGTRFTRRNEESGLLDGEIIYTDYAKIAEGYGCKAYRVTNAEELYAALEDSKKQTVSTLFDIKVAHKSMTDGYDSWWRVGVAEVSESETVQKCYEDMKENIAKARLY